LLLAVVDLFYFIICAVVVGLFYKDSDTLGGDSVLGVVAIDINVDNGVVVDDDDSDDQS